MTSVQYITVVSNASQNYFPRNTPSEFTNKLPHIIRSPSNVLFVRLRAIGISPSLEEADPLAHYIEIHISELEPQATNYTYDQCLARVRYPPGKSFTRYAVQEYENTPFLEVRAPLHSISVSIRNSVGEVLALKETAPTFIQLEISTEDMTGQFNITCFSHLQEELRYFSMNTLNKFRVMLPSYMALKNYQVAITSVVFPPDLQLRTPTMWLKLKFNNVERTFYFEADDYTSTEAFLHDVFESILEDDLFPFFIEFSINENPQDKFYKQLQLWVMQLHGADHITLSCSDEFARACGMVQTQRENIDIPEGYGLTFGKPNLNLAKTSSVIMLYSSCVEPNIVGHGMHRLLHIIPVDSSKSIYEPEKLIFHRVISSSFRTIEFELQQPRGVAHNLFSESNSSIAISLLFIPEDIDRDE